MNITIATDVDFAKLGVRPVAYRSPKIGEFYMDSFGRQRRCYCEVTKGHCVTEQCLIVEPIPRWQPPKGFPCRGWLYQCYSDWVYSCEKPEAVPAGYTASKSIKGWHCLPVDLVVCMFGTEPFVPPTAETWPDGDYRCIDLSQFREATE